MEGPRPLQLEDGGGGGGGGERCKLAHRVRLCPIHLFNCGVFGIKNRIANCNGYYLFYGEGAKGHGPAIPGYLVVQRVEVNVMGIAVQI